MVHLGRSAKKMTDSETNHLEQDIPIFWGPVSIAIPTAALVIGFLFVAGASKGVGGDMVGFGFLIYAAVAVGAAGIFGAAAAIRAIKKEEKWIAFAFVGLLLNLAFIAVGGFYASILFR
ncbi:hypothetical protein Ga0100231_008050 [Opitutaceae bacterium TAV4]|nr:hypothetical protein Ga0100231_008050 [Opitutaceae bacterium TAV4]RRJ98407.1 hypothetical protein Ga0100230_008350 [Opitutaceae bacterium TAV3]